jgi:hypothetical protein
MIQTLALIAAFVTQALVETKQQFTLFIFESEAEIAKRTSSADTAKYWSSYSACANKMQEAGVLKGGAPLQFGPQAKSVTVKGGKISVAPGAPYAMKGHLGGYFIIEVPNMEAALKWASTIPASQSGSVMVVPHFEAPKMTGQAPENGQVKQR